MLCLPTERHPAMSLSTLEAPLKLGRICNSWQSFAYSCPRLWARIHISVLHLAETPEEGSDIEPDVGMEEGMTGRHRHLDGVNEWLTRSRSHPLSISVFEPLLHALSGAVLPLLTSDIASLLKAMARSGTPDYVGWVGF